MADDDSDKVREDTLLAVLIIMTAMQEGNTAEVCRLVDEYEQQWLSRRSTT